MPWAQPKKNLNYKDFKKDVVYIYICIYVLCTCINTMEYYLAIKKELNIATCNNIDGPREYHNEWNKADRERLFCYHLYMESKI